MNKYVRNQTTRSEVNNQQTYCDQAIEMNIQNKTQPDHEHSMAITTKRR